MQERKEHPSSSPELELGWRMRNYRWDEEGRGADTWHQHYSRRNRLNTVLPIPSGSTEPAVHPATCPPSLLASPVPPAQSEYLVERCANPPPVSQTEVLFIPCPCFNPHCHVLLHLLTWVLHLSACCLFSSQWYLVWGHHIGHIPTCVVIE